VDGKWTITAVTGNDSGFYNFLDDNTAVCKNAAGIQVVWKRDAAPGAAVAPVRAPQPNDVTPELRADIAAKMRLGDYAGAWGDLARIQSWKSTDPATIALDAAVRLGMGQLDVARNEAALVLQWEGHLDDADALRTHAEASAAMGDLRQATADLQIFKRLRPDEAAAIEKWMSETATRPPAGCAPDQVIPQFNQLLKMAGSGGDAEALVQQATVVLKGHYNARKVEFDLYRQHKRELTAAATADPNNGPKWAALAQFIFDQSLEIHGDSGIGYKPVNPSFRYSNPKGEQQQAIALCDKALQLDRMNVQARAIKAGALIQLRRDDEARQMITEAMQIDPNHPEVLRMFGQLMIFNSWDNTNAGDRLSAPTMTEDDKYVYIHSRSDQDLAQARFYNGLAANQLQGAQGALQTAVDRIRGTAAGFYYAAVLAQRNGDKQAAISNIQQAVTMEPGNSAYHIYLGDLDARLGPAGEASSLEQYSAADNLYQSSASKLVNLAWHELRNRDYAAAQQTLDRALQLDPTDPRVAGYMGLMVAGQTGDKSNVDKAAAWLLAGWAMEEARLRVGGIRTTPRSFLYNANNLGLEMALAASAGQRLLMMRRPEIAYGMLKVTLENAGRVDPAEINFSVKTALLPLPSLQDPIVPGKLESMKAPTVNPHTYWLRNCHQLAASALTAMGRSAEAAKENAQAGGLKDVPRDMSNPLLPGQGPIRR
jgi:tetratricopeptide (TPR) repeat protein